MEKLKNHNFFNSSVLRTLILFTVISIFFAGLVNSSVVYAAAPQGCYNATSGGYIKVDCPSGIGNNGGADTTTACWVAVQPDSGPLGNYEAKTSCNFSYLTTGTSNPATTPNFQSPTEENITGSNLDIIKKEGNCSGEDPSDVNKTVPLDSSNCAIVGYLVRGINILSAVAGMAIIGSIMIAGYQYMTASDDPAKIQAARKRIVMAGSALLLFIFMYGLLNFLVPGGVL